MADRLSSRERRVLAHRHGKAEPARVGALSGFRQDQELVHSSESLLKEREVAPPSLDETRNFVQLRKTDGCLHVGDLEVVADMRVGVFVVVAERQLAQLPAETFAAGVGLAGI